jgi:hypothetical protein
MEEMERHIHILSLRSARRAGFFEPSSDVGQICNRQWKVATGPRALTAQMQASVTTVSNGEALKRIARKRQIGPSGQRVVVLSESVQRVNRQRETQRLRAASATAPTQVSACRCVI